MCYTKIPKNTGILFSKIPVSVFESNPGIPVFSGIPQGPGGGVRGALRGGGGHVAVRAPN